MSERLLPLERAEGDLDHPVTDELAAAIATAINQVELGAVPRTSSKSVDSKLPAAEPVTEGAVELARRGAAVMLAVRFTWSLNPEVAMEMGDLEQRIRAKSSCNWIAPGILSTQSGWERHAVAAAVDNDGQDIVVLQL